MRKISITLVLCLILVALVPYALSAQEPAAKALALDEAIAMAKEHNSQLKMAALSLEQAEAEFKGARADLWPSLDVSVSYTSADSENTTFPVTVDIPGGPTVTMDLTMPGSPPYASSFSLTQPLFTSPLYVKYEMARKTWDLRRLEYSEAQEDMTYNVTTAYYQVVKGRLGREVAKRSLQQAEANLRTAQAQFTAGLLAKNQVLQVELAVANAQQSYLRMNNLYQLSLAGLRMQLGLAQNSPVEVAAAINPPAGEIMKDPPLEAVEKRFDVQKAGIAVEMAGLGVRMARSGYLPMASLRLNYATGGDSLTFSGGSTSITLAARWTYSVGGKTQAAVKAAEANLARAEEALKLSLEGGKLNIIQAHLELLEAAERARLTAMTLNVARENLRLATKRYELGAGTPQEATDAQLSLEQAEMNDLNARYDLFLGEQKLAKALGRLHE